MNTNQHVFYATIIIMTFTGTVLDPEHGHIGHQVAFQLYSLGVVIPCITAAAVSPVLFQLLRSLNVISLLPSYIHLKMLARNLEFD